MATILIVDDHPTNRDFITMLLSYQGHHLLEAADGAEGLRLARAEHPDLIITDVLMPTIDGYEFVQRLRAEPAMMDTPIIFWSAYYLEREARALALACGVLHILMKPCEPEEVLHTVQAALDHVLRPVAVAPPENFEQAHVRVMTDKLAQTVEELRTANQKLGAVLETSRRLALAHDLPQLLEDCARKAREIIGAQWALIGIWTDDGQALRHFATAGLAPELLTLLGTPHLQRGIFSRLFHGQSVCRLTNASGAPQILGFAPGYPPIYALLGAAIAAPSRVYGCLVLANKLGTEVFSEADERLATTLAAQLAVAYENASLYAALTQHAAELGREVAEHQRTEAQLQRAETRYRTLVEHMPAITYVSALHPDDGTLYISPQVEAILGYTPAEWNASPHIWSTRLHPQDRPRILARLAHSRTTGEALQAEYRLYARDNREIWFQHEAVIVKDDQTGELCFQGMLHDITARKRTEATLAERAQMTALATEVGAALTQDAPLQAILQQCSTALVRHLDVSLLGIWTLSPDEPILTLQASVALDASLTGMPSRVPVGVATVGRIAQERQAYLTNTVEQDPHIHEQDWASREGMTAFAGQPLLVGTRLVGVLAIFARAPLRPATGEALALVTPYIALGIERLWTTDALHDSEARYRDLLEHANDMIDTRDLDGTFTSCNRQGEHITGYNRDEILRLTFSDLAVPEQRPGVDTIIARTLQGATPVTSEVTIVTKQGHRVTLEVRTRLLLSGAGKPVGVQDIARDVTERNLLEAQLRQAQKMEALGTMAGGIAHDFNNILSAIFGYTELTLDDVPSGSLAWQNLQQVLVASKRARELVQHLLAFSHKGEQVRRPTFLPFVAREVLTLLRATLPATITLRATLDNTVGYVLADPIQMQQVLLNLCTNAAHAMRATGGELEVRLEACDIPAKLATLSPPLKPGTYLRFTVRDTGPGIPPELLERIFEPFFTTKGPGEGTGLGLAVAHGIIASHGGAITVASTPGEGATFEVYLPWSEQVPTTGSVAVEGAIPSGHECILFVDDEEPLVMVRQEALSRLGYTVVFYTSGLAALEAFRATPARFDLLITDQTMPHMTGAELIQAVRRIRPDLPVILCTGFSHTMTAARAAALRIDAFCMKPLPLRDLAVLIRQILDQRAGP